tara:strand:+ start:45 stop:359 length:315 start_codon:yes stop_codon:yes gene_type:complete
MRLEGESYAIDVGTFVMNYHHGLLRLGVVKTKTVGDDGWSYFDVRFFEDDIHERRVEWDKKMNSKKEHTNVIRGDWLKPVSAEWLRNVLLAYGEYKYERRTEAC